MIIKKALVYISIACFIFTAGLGLGGYITYSKMNKLLELERNNYLQLSTGENNKQAADLQNVQAATQSYILKEFNGKAAVYKKEDDASLKLEYYVNQIDPKTLREEDRKRLSEGIAAASKQEIAALIEDFGS